MTGIFFATQILTYKFNLKKYTAYNAVYPSKLIIFLVVSCIIYTVFYTINCIIYTICYPINRIINSIRNTVYSIINSICDAIYNIIVFVIIQIVKYSLTKKENSPSHFFQKKMEFLVKNGFWLQLPL